MNFEIIITGSFDVKAKRLLKKFSSLREELTTLVHQLKEAPIMGSPLGHECYKIRLSIKSKGKGKSGGARVITCARIIKNTVYLLDIYDKSEQEDITKERLQELIKLVDGMAN